MPNEPRIKPSADSLIDTSNLSGMKRFFIHAFNDDGESHDLFVSAFDAVSARRLYDVHCANNEWKPTGKVVFFEVPSSQSPRALEWGTDVKRVQEWIA